MIHTATGLKAIETFHGGELVLSRDEHTGESGYRPVVGTKRTELAELFEIEVGTATGERELLHTTSEHPFRVGQAAGSAWVRAAGLESGMILLDATGSPLTVLSQRSMGLSAPVFNIEVSEYHTYHVGELGVWVHNANCCDLVNQDVVEPTKRGVISNTKLAENHIALDMTPAQQSKAWDIVKNGDPYGTKTEELMNSVAESHRGQVLDGGKYGSNNGFDHVLVWTDAEGNVNLTLSVDSKQVGLKGATLDPKAAGGQMQMSAEWDDAVLRRLPDDSPAKRAILAAKEDGTLVKAVAYVDKNTGALNLIRIDPKAQSVKVPALPEPPKQP